MNTTKRILTILPFLAAIAFISGSCSKESGPTFTVKGNITNAAGREIGIYNIGAEGISALGTATLDESGAYEFKAPSPEGFDFYLISVDSCGQAIFVVDSTETVTINADGKEFTSSYTADGNSENMRIKEIEELRNALDKQASTLAMSTSPAIAKTRKDIQTLVDDFKQNIMKQYIVTAPGSASAYYALTLSLAGKPIFNPLTNRTDCKCFAAVATAYQQLHPGTKHTRHITEIAKKGLEATRPQQEIELEVEESSASIQSMFDIKLPTEKGDTVALSSLKGKVVLLDFTIYENTNLATRNMEFRKTYDKYRKQGLEIYQVSLDRREHFWQQSATNFPWICVRDSRGAAARLYNVGEIPTYFLINRDGEVVLRNTQVKDLNKEIEKLLGAR